MATIHLLLGLLTLILQPARGTQCYNPDGSKTTSDYQPCHEGGPSMCCALNRTNSYLNTCRPDNLCVEINSQHVYRESCSDPTWKDPACLQLCTTGFDLGYQGTENATQTDVPITVCGDGSYCCGVNNTLCCTTGQGYWMLNNVVYPHTSSPFSTSASPVSSSTSTCAGGSAAGANHPTSTCTSHSSATKIALGVGLAVGIPLLILLGSILFLVARKNVAARENRTQYEGVLQSEAQKVNPYPPAQLDSQDHAAELEADQTHPGTWPDTGGNMTSG